MISIFPIDIIGIWLPPWGHGFIPLLVSYRPLRRSAQARRGGVPGLPLCSPLSRHNPSGSAGRRGSSHPARGGRHPFRHERGLSMPGNLPTGLLPTGLARGTPPAAAWSRRLSRDGGDHRPYPGARTVRPAAPAPERGPAPAPAPPPSSHGPSPPARRNSPRPGGSPRAHRAGSLPHGAATGPGSGSSARWWSWSAGSW